MYVLTKDAFHGLRALAMLVMVALLFWSVGLTGVIKNASAANVVDFSDTLSDSDVSQPSNHTIEFTLTTAMAAGQNFTISFPAAFDTSAIDIGDIDIASSSVDQTATTTNGVNQWGVTGLGTDDITFQAPSNVGVASGVTLTIEIGDHASFTATGDEQIVNPTAGSYRIELAGSMPDTGATNVYIIDDVLVSASVETSFTFSVNGLPAGSAAHGSATTTATTTTSTTLPFEVLAPNTSKTLAQRLNVSTNADGGFVVTVEQDGDLLNATAASIDGFANGLYTNTPSVWSSPTGNINNDDTWGHWGLTSSDVDFSATPDRWVSASTTPRTVFSHTGPADGVTAGVGSTTVGYQAQITSLQEAGDYTAILTYIATPTF